MARKSIASRLKKRTARAYHRVGGSDVVRRREAAVAFAARHDLIHFHTLAADSDDVSVIRGSTATPDQVDSNFCIGTHAGYDIAVVERAADVAFVGFEPTFHRWYVLQIDLKRAHDLPFIFLGTRQLTKAFYAKVMVSHRDISYLQLSLASAMLPAFHGQYALISSPLQLYRINTLFTAEVIDAIAAHKHQIAIEIEGDSLIVFTEATKPSEQLLNELLHYALWLAKLIDERLA